MNNNNNENNDKIMYRGWEDSKSNNTSTEKKESLAIPKETYDNSLGVDLENEDKPYAVVKGKNRGKVKILNKILLFLTFIFFALIVMYLYKMMPYK